MAAEVVEAAIEPAVAQMLDAKLDKGMRPFLVDLILFGLHGKRAYEA
jgi:hypothetical protein